MAVTAPVYSHPVDSHSLCSVIYECAAATRPSVTETLEVAQAARRYLMGIHARIAGGPANVSWKFSGKDRAGTPLAGHRHAYILPMDLDHDGWLDHLVVHCREPFDETEQRALLQLERLWLGRSRCQVPGVRCQGDETQGRGTRIEDRGTYQAPAVGRREERTADAGSYCDGVEIRLTPADARVAAQLFAPSRVLASTTPFVPPRHYRKGRGEFTEWLESEVRHEAVNHGLPEPAHIAPLARLECKTRSLAWQDFALSRKNDRMRIGYGFTLELSQPAAGPIALGYGAHFGLGQFAQRSDE